MFVGNVAISTTPLRRLFQRISTITTHFFLLRFDSQFHQPANHSQTYVSWERFGGAFWNIFNFMGYHLDLLPTQ